jgi:CxxC motif-containing protein (DUF1111 family)
VVRLTSMTVSLALFTLATAADRNPSTEVRDPGIRPEHTDAGSMLRNLSGPERQLFAAGREIFERINSVKGNAVVADTEAGLGPVFNLDRCAGCHAYPTTGGSSPAENPQITVATREGATNLIPSFLRADGPVYQVRSIPFGNVVPLFTICGRRDAGTCEMRQPNFEKEFSSGRLRFRVPPPLFGDGLIEAIPDVAIIDNRDLKSDEKRRLGIHGRLNCLPSSNLVGRFGWKAQTRSLDIFAAEAYWIEQGVTSELFPEERGAPPANCLLNVTPEDRKNTAARRPVDALSNVSLLAHYVRFLAPLSHEMQSDRNSRQGEALFTKIGCALCHTPELRTGGSAWPSLAGQTAALYSDSLLHHMGAGLADGLSDGSAGPDEFRTAPLWGLGNRVFLLHDGRTKDLVQAIISHSDRSSRRAKAAHFPRSEAEGVIENYLRLSSIDQQSLLHFLRSL